MNIWNIFNSLKYLELLFYGENMFRWFYKNIFLSRLEIMFSLVPTLSSCTPHLTGLEHTTGETFQMHSGL